MSSKTKSTRSGEKKGSACWKPNLFQPSENVVLQNTSSCPLNLIAETLGSGWTLWFTFSIAHQDVLEEPHDSYSVRDCGYFLCSEWGITGCKPPLYERTTSVCNVLRPLWTTAAPRKLGCSLMCCWALRATQSTRAQSVICSRQMRRPRYQRACTQPWRLTGRRGTQREGQTFPCCPCLFKCLPLPLLPAQGNN